jgi:hypothetical protein
MSCKTEYAYCSLRDRQSELMIFVSAIACRPISLHLTSMGVCTFGIFMEQLAVIRYSEEMKKCSKRFAEGRTSLYDGPRCGRPIANDLTEVLSSMLKDRPSLSRKALCRHFRVARETCLRILHATLGMKKFQLRWISHAMDASQKAERVALSHGILSLLQNICSTGFQSVITGSESWPFM